MGFNNGIHDLLLDVSIDSSFQFALHVLANFNAKRINVIAFDAIGCKQLCV